MNLEQLLARQSALLNQMRALANQASLTTEESSQYDALETEYDNNEKSIARLQNLANREGMNNAPVNKPVVVTVVNEPMPKPYKNFVEQLADVKAAAHGQVSDNLRKHWRWIRRWFCCSDRFRWPDDVYGSNDWQHTTARG